MSTVKAINFQHPDAASPAITLDANGDVSSMDTDNISEGSTNLYYTDGRADARIAAADLGDLSDVDTTGAADGEALVFSSGSWAPAEVGGGLSGTSYVFVAGDGTAAENGTALQAAYTAAKALTPYGNALADTNRAWVVVAPGSYDTTLTMDTQYVNVVSLDGETSVRLTGISVKADNVLVRGIDTGTAAFTVDPSVPGLILDFNGLVVEECRGGDNSFGYFIRSTGTYINCTAGNFSFGTLDRANGTYINCTAGNFSFGGDDNSGDGYQSTGTFINCTAGNYSFSGCAPGGKGGSASGTYERCTGGIGSFGGGDSFIDGAKIRWSRLTSGTFNTPFGGGKIRLSLDGDDNEVNTG